MPLEQIQERLQQYTFQTKQDEENVIKEICQEIALAALARADFFKIGAFQGGTCLRILFGLNRFSEDLDFVLKAKDKLFTWTPFLKAIQLEFDAFGLQCDALDRSEATGNVKKAFLKENSFGKVLNLKFKRNQADLQKVAIKLEIDTNPPLGSSFSSHYLDYPYPFSIVSQDNASLFAGKCHALLCREYVKGRDWYDFIWYVQRQTGINLDLLKNALEQQGPYRGQNMDISKNWLLDQLEQKINDIDWNLAKKDIAKFIIDARQINLWDRDYFLHVLHIMKKYL